MTRRLRVFENQASTGPPIRFPDDRSGSTHHKVAASPRSTALESPAQLQWAPEKQESRRQEPGTPNRPITARERRSTRRHTNNSVQAFIEYRGVLDTIARGGSCDSPRDGITRSRAPAHQPAHIPHGCLALLPAVYRQSVARDMSLCPPSIPPAEAITCLEACRKKGVPSDKTAELKDVATVPTPVTISAICRSPSTKVRQGFKKKVHPTAFSGIIASRAL